MMSAARTWSFSATVRPATSRTSRSLSSSSTASSRARSTAEACVLNVNDESSPIPAPCVVKPVHDGSSVGLHICKDAAMWPRVRQTVREDVRSKPGRVYMIERFISGKELTVGMLDGKPLPTIHIAPADGPYDYEAKYTRDDTQYHLNPTLPEGADAAIKSYASKLFDTLGCRHVSRVDFILDQAGRPWLLEINTMPGFTSHSLVPKAAASVGIPMPDLCSRLTELAIRDHAAR